MKSAVAVTLIIAGAGLISLPAISDAWRTFLFARLMEHGLSNFNIEGQMGELYRIGCWLAGTLMLLVAVLGSVAHMPSTNEP